MSNRTRTAAYLIALSAIAVLSRLPQLRSPNLLLDGDECVLGLMARHAMRGEVPLFFWGQHYGLSTIEALAGALGFAIFGLGALQLKLAMLGLWTVGVLFLFLAQSSLIGARYSFWITAVFVLSPAWAVWSMKARGGYLTAFAASSILFWVLVRPPERGTVARWPVAGALTAIIGLAQPLWLAGIISIVAAAALASHRRKLAIAVYAGVAAATVLLIKLSSVPSATAWPPPTLWNPAIAGMTFRVAQQIYVNMTGSYYLGWAIDPPGAATTVMAMFWCAVLPVLALLQIYRLATHRFLRWSHVLFVGACATVLANWILLFVRDARYMLPLSGLVVPLAGIEIVDLVDRRIVSRGVARGVAVAALLLGTTALWEFREFNFLWSNPPYRLSESKRMQQVIRTLTALDVHHVFSMNALLGTQIIFYSDERVIARWASANDRHPAYVAAVNGALLNREPVAIIGYTDSSGAPGCWDAPVCTGGLAGLVSDPERILTVDGKYFVYVGGNTELLRNLHFRVPD